MPRPLRASQLVEMPAERVSGFPPSEWLREFGPYQWFYIRNARRVISASGIPTVSMVADFHLRAIGECPENWKQEMPAGEWRSFARPQVFRVFKTLPVRFDKACMSIICIESAMKWWIARHGKQISNLDIYEYLRIVPAIFVVDGLSEAFRSTIAGDRALLEKMANHIGQSQRFIERSSREGYAMTYNSAKKIAEFLRDSGFRRSEVRALFGRTDRGRLRVKTPNPDEFLAWN